MTKPKRPIPDWVTRGKTIRQVIAELQTFEDQDMEVRMSFDYGDTHRCVSIIQRQGDCCVLVNTEDYHNNDWQSFMNEHEDS
jgi:hypothetical protein